MKRIKSTIFALAVLLFGCQQVELADPNNTGAVKMKTVTISAGIDDTDTKASLDSQTGAFTWQSGDLISVLATDGNFYDFILKGEYGSKIAEFVGNIPAGAEVTTVATYPRIVADGTANTVLTGNTLNYVLPAIWNYAKDVSNVPMVATFGEGAEHMSFKQVGGVMRFPVKNLPPKAQFVMTMADKTITGSFPVDITKLGEGAMVAGAEASVLTINYSSDVDGAYAEFNVPVPTGTYNNFKVEVKDAEGNVLFEKNYSADNTVNRATLLNMKELVLPDRPMATPEVWPFFVDARVVFSPYEGVTDYAFYIDGADTPVILAAEDVNGGKVGALIGGEFSHNTTHKVAVAKVVDGTPVAESKSEAVEFKTADIRQLTTNTGTKFVSVGWDDVAIGWGPKYDAVNKKWSAVSKADNPDDVSVHHKRGYQVQLLAADKTTVIYDMIPFDGHAAFTGTFSDSSWLGKVGGNNILIPTALAFGYLEPGKDYYFRVKTLDETAYMGLANGNYNPEDNGKYPVPYPIYSERGGCAWSNLIKLSTDPAHVASENEILYEGFDDIMVANDYMNWAPGVVPDLEQERIDWDTYRDVNMKTTYPAFLNKPASERKWTTQAFSETIKADVLGLMDNPYVPGSQNELNELAGTLNGWAVSGSSEKRSMYPIFGAIRLGQSGSNGNGAILYTPAIKSDKLRNDVRTKCKVTLNVAYCATSVSVNELSSIIQIIHCDNNLNSISKATAYNVAEIYPSDWEENNGSSLTTSDYVHYQQYYVVEHELYLKNGDILGFEKPSGKKGFLTIGDISIIMVPGEFEEGITNPDDMGLGTEPDDTDYDVFNMNELPISYYHGAPTRVYTKVDPNTGQAYYDYEATKQIFQDIKDAGINVVTYTGSCDYSIEENKRLLGICEELGLKFFSAYQGGHTYSMDWITAVKENLYSSDAYLGDFIRDEPNASEFESMGAYVKEFLRQMPDKEVYVNLFPEYANSTQLGTTTYEAHIDKYLATVPTKTISFDYYGLEKQATWLTKTYHHNYDMVRAKSLNRRMPYWVITAAGGIGTGRKDPTQKELRWQVWSSLALGSKGISYFTYWTPDGDPNLATNEYMITRDGEKRDIYYWIKQVNADINTIGKKLLNCHADGTISSVTSIYPVYYNDGSGRTNYGPIKGVSGSVDYLCGCFRDARRSEMGDNYKGYKALVTHLLPARGDFSISLTLDQSVGEIAFTHNNTTTTLTIDNTLNQSIGPDVTVSYTGGVLTLNMPEGEAILLEF